MKFRILQTGLAFFPVFTALAIMGIAPETATADASIERGKAVYNGTGACSACHGPNGEGDGPAAATLTPKPRNFSTADFGIDTDGDGTKGSADDIFNVISNGALKYGGSAMMVGRPDLPESDRKALTEFVLSLKK
jgi:mono/diheme cytochrome c family protein